MWSVEPKLQMGPGYWFRVISLWLPARIHLDSRIWVLLDSRKWILAKCTLWESTFLGIAAYEQPLPLRMALVADSGTYHLIEGWKLASEIFFFQGLCLWKEVGKVPKVKVKFRESQCFFMWIQVDSRQGQLARIFPRMIHSFAAKFWPWSLWESFEIWFLKFTDNFSIVSSKYTWKQLQFLSHWNDVEMVRSVCLTQVSMANVTLPLTPVSMAKWCLNLCFTVLAYGLQKEKVPD